MTISLRAERWIRGHFTLVAAIVAVVAAVYGAVMLLTPLRGGWLFISGCATAVVGLRMGLSVTDDVGPMLRRLSDAGSLEGDPAQLEAAIEHRADSYAEVGGIAIGALMIVVFSATYWVLAPGTYPTIVKLFLTGTATVGGYVVGRVLGRMVAVGRLGTTIASSQQWAVRPQVHGLDGAAGLAPVGYMYLHQAGTLLVPAVFFAGWWFAIPLSPSLSGYASWRPLYLGLLTLSVLAQLLVFVLPILSFHAQMDSWREGVIRSTEQQSARRLRELDAALATTEDPRARAVIKEEVASITERYESARRLPTWPVDGRTRRRITIRNFVLLIPLLGKLGKEDFWTSVASAIGDVFD